MASRGHSSSIRRGRGFGRGAFGNNASSREQHEEPAELDESPEMAKLRARWGSELPALKTIFGDWQSDELLLLLQDAGSVEAAASRIAEGKAERFESVGAKKPKPQTAGTRRTFETAETASVPSSTFAGRGRGRGGIDASRGGFRGRGDFRGGRGGFRGGRGAFRGGANGHVAPAPKSSTEPASDVITSEIWGAEATDGSASVSVEKIEGDGVEAVIVTETSTQPNGDVVQETTAVVESIETKQDTPANDGWGDVAPAAAPAPKPRAAAKVIQPGSKISWAQIARPPPPAQAAPKPEPTVAPTQAPPAPAPQIEIPVVIPQETAPLLAKEEEAPSQDPWNPEPAVQAAPEIPDVPQGVGEGWAEAVLAADSTVPQPEKIEQHLRAEAAVPSVGSDPAGPLDVHTPVPEALPEHQKAFNLPSTLSQSSPAQPQQNAQIASAAERVISPPGLSKRGISRGQDAAVVISGATPGIEGMGVQFGSLNIFGSNPSELNEQPQQQQGVPSVQTSLYETPVLPSEPTQQAPAQPSQQSAASTTDHNQFGLYQQAPAANEPNYAQDAFATLAGFNSQQQQQQAQQQQSQQNDQTSNFFNQFGGQAQSAFSQQPGFQRQTSQHQPQQSYSSDFFGASPYNQQPQQAQQQNFGGFSSEQLAAYFSAQQAQQQAQTSQSVPTSARDNATQAPNSASAYSGFTSALPQTQQQQMPQKQQQQQQQYGGYPTDYSSMYGQQPAQDPLARLGFYNQYEQYAMQAQQAQQARAAGAPKADTAGTQNGRDAAGTPGAQGNNAQHQQPQHQMQQQPQYPPNFAPYGYPYQQYYGMPPYNQQQGYPGYHSPYAPYPGYGAQGAGANRPYSGQSQQPAQQQQQPAQQQQGAFQRYGQGGASGGLPAQTGYGAPSAYNSYEAPRSASQNTGAQDNRSSTQKDMFGDRFFGQY